MVSSYLRVVIAKEGLKRDTMLSSYYGKREHRCGNWPRNQRYVEKTSLHHGGLSETIRC